MLENLKNCLDTELGNLKKTIKKPNILLVGGTGVGKSSLINSIFGGEIAPAGAGTPVTKGIHPYQSNNASVILYDAEGYEIGADQQRRFDQSVVEFASANAANVEAQIHIIWYCIAATSDRVLDLDRELITRLSATRKPVAVVLTKCDKSSSESITKMTKELLSCSRNIFRSTNVKLPNNLGYLDLEKLCSWSCELLPDQLKYGFIRSQRINLEQKREHAMKIIYQHSAGAGVIGAAPIPFSDAPLLIANQAGMFARILFVYDMEPINNLVGKILSSLGTGALVSRFGIYLVGELAKLIPGAGSVVGGVINGSVAAGITASLGLAINEFCYHVARCVLDGPLTETDMEKLLNTAEDFLEKEFKNQQKDVSNFLKNGPKSAQ